VKRRVILTTPYDLAVYGGVNNQLFGLYRYLRALDGYEILVIGPSSQPEAISDEAIFTIGKVSTLRMNGAKSNLTLEIGIGGRIKEILRDFDPHIVHLQEPFAPILNTWVLKHSRAINVGTFHTYSETGRGYYWAKPLLWWKFKRLHLRIAVSEAARRYVGGAFPGPYEIVPNAIDGREDREDDCEGALRLSPERTKRLLFIGRMDEDRKGFEYLLQAMALLGRGRVGKYRLVAVGTGAERWQEETSGLDVQYTGKLTSEELQMEIRRCDLLCAPSTGGESFGVILLEAMIFGKPVVASRIEGYRELIGESEAGVLVDKEDGAALAEGIKRVLGDETGYVRRTEEARRLAEYYTWAETGPRITGFYERTYSESAK
jgi:phosphatidylinositol alpha-mannosyltransferase